MMVVDQPLFLIGSVRSGTTLLRLMLDHHPEIAFNLESEFLVSQLPDDGSWPDMAEYHRWLAADRVFRHSRFEIKPELGYVELANDFLAQKMIRDGKRIVGATVHHDFSRLARIWPRGRYIYLLLDGRDVARSVMQMGWAGNIWAATRVWLAAEAEWAAMRPALRPEQWIEIRFEELILDTRRVLGAICAFMGTEFSDRMLDYTRTSSYDMPDPALVHQWKRKLSPRQVQLVESVIGDALAARGYELSTHPRLCLSAGSRLWLKVNDRIGKVRHRVAMIGVRLFVLDLLARRLGLRHQSAKLQARIDAIIDANLR